MPVLLKVAVSEICATWFDSLAGMWITTAWLPITLVSAITPIACAWPDTALAPLVALTSTPAAGELEIAVGLGLAAAAAAALGLGTAVLEGAGEALPVELEATDRLSELLPVCPAAAAVPDCAWAEPWLETLTLSDTLTVLDVELAPCLRVTDCWLVTLVLAITPSASAPPLVAEDEL